MRNLFDKRSQLIWRVPQVGTSYLTPSSIKSLMHADDVTLITKLKNQTISANIDQTFRKHWLTLNELILKEKKDIHDKHTVLLTI